MVDVKRFERFLGRIGKGLTASQCLRAAAVLRQKAHSGMAQVIIERGEEMVRETRTCRRCGHGDVVLHGKDANGRQRFRCRVSPRGGCGRTFNGLAGTVLQGMHKPDQWMAYVGTMPVHLSVAKTARRLGVSHVTAHRWRHRLLSVQKVQEAPKLTGW